MKKCFLFLLVMFSFIVPSHAVILSHMSYVTRENFPTENSEFSATFNVDENFWFVFRNSETNNTTLIISSRTISDDYTQNNATMPVVGDSTISFSTRQNRATYLYTYLYNVVSGTWDFQSRQYYFGTAEVVYPASYLYQSVPVNFYNSSGEVVFPGPLEIWNLRLGETIVRAEVPAVRSTMKTLALFGVGCLALLIILSLFGNPFRLFLRR